MESQSSRNHELVVHILNQLREACNFIMLWNANINAEDDYLSSPDGMQKMAASCMMLESIGEGVKKIDKLIPGFLIENEPDILWKQIKGMRDRIAHGYFELDSSIIYDASVNEIPLLNDAFSRLLQKAYGN